MVGHDLKKSIQFLEVISCFDDINDNKKCNNDLPRNRLCSRTRSVLWLYVLHMKVLITRETEIRQTSRVWFFWWMILINNFNVQCPPTQWKKQRQQASVMQKVYNGFCTKENIKWKKRCTSHSERGSVDNVIRFHICVSSYNMS